VEHGLAAVKGNGSRLRAPRLHYEYVLWAVVGKEAIDAVAVVPAEEAVAMEAEAEPISAISHALSIISPLASVRWRTPAPRTRQQGAISTCNRVLSKQANKTSSTPCNDLVSRGANPATTCHQQRSHYPSVVTRAMAEAAESSTVCCTAGTGRSARDRSCLC